MSAAVADGCFLSALQPNSSRTAYVVPSDGRCSDAGAKARRVQEQVRLRLAEKKSPSLGRLAADDYDDDAPFGPAAGERRPRGNLLDCALSCRWRRVALRCVA